jgi:three-Cys-motif partner protein
MKASFAGGWIVGQTKDFFKEKKAWSVLKDEILDYYLVPYIAKILRTGKPLYIFDCFAGKGKFDNGINGSPIIIAEHIKEYIQRNQVLGGKLKGTFIEKKYSAELSKNLSDYPNTEVLSGTFEDNLKTILSLDKNSSIFLYVDPYGIKSLNLNNFNRVKERHFSSLELLMNFNSAGFLREGCRLLKYTELPSDDELTDYESDEDINTIDLMDSIAGGTYWKEIVKKYYDNTIDIYQAEAEFISEYSRRLRNIFKYTVNIPIKVKSSHLPKYRLIFGSNHEDGLILMADNMNKKWKQMLENQRGGQLVLFDFGFAGVTTIDLHNNILSVVAENSSGVPLRELIVNLIQKYGITFSESAYKEKIKQMGQSSDLVVDRVPAMTSTGKPAISMDYGKYKITVSERI